MEAVIKSSSRRIFSQELHRCFTLLQGTVFPAMERMSPCVFLWGWWSLVFVCPFEDDCWSALCASLPWSSGTSRATRDAKASGKPPNNREPLKEKLRSATILVSPCKLGTYIVMSSAFGYRCCGTSECTDPSKSVIRCPWALSS